MFDGAAVVPLLSFGFRVFRLISLGELLCFIHVENTLFRVYYWTVIHLSSTQNYSLVYLLFYHFLPVEVSFYFYIISLVVSFSRFLLFRLAKIVLRLVSYPYPSYQTLSTSIS